MALQSGVETRVSIAKEATWGVKPAAGTAKEIRRVELTSNLERANFRSNEITSTAQTTDSRNGNDNVTGTLGGELSPNSYTDIWAALLRGNWVAGSSFTGITVSATATGFARSAGSWLTSGFKKGDLVKVSGFTNSANNGYWLVTAVTATDLDVGTTADKAPVVEAAGASVTVAVQGKKLSIPLTIAGRTDDSFTIEQFYVTNNSARLSTGVKFGNAEVSVAPNQMATCSFGLMGRTQEKQTGAYFTAPAAPAANGVLSGSKGMILINGVSSGVVTQYNFSIDGGMETSLVVGQRQAADISLGRISATGSMSVFFDGDAIYDAFKAENDIALVFWLEGDADESMVFKFPRVRLNGANIDDKETGNLLQTVPFEALLEGTAQADDDQSTIVIQDTTVV